MAKTTRRAKPEAQEKPVVVRTPKYNPGDWRDPASSFAPDDDSLEARMWRLARRGPTAK